MSIQDKGGRIQAERMVKKFEPGLTAEVTTLPWLKLRLAYCLPLTDTVGALLALAALEGAVPMERNWPRHRGVWAGTRALVFDVQNVVKQSSQEEDALPRQLRVHLVGCSRDGDPRVDADLAPFRLAGEAAKLLPGAHLTQAFGGQIGQPVCRACMGLRPVLLLIVAQQPGVGLSLGFRLMEVVQGV